MLSSSELMRTYLEEVAGNGRLDLIEQIARPDMIDEANVAFGGPPGRDGLVAHVKGFRRHIDECELTIHKIIGEQSEVVAWWSFTGKHVGPWLGVPPTGDDISGEVFSFFSLEEGLIRRYRLWLYTTLNSGMTIDSAKLLHSTVVT